MGKEKINMFQTFKMAYRNLNRNRRRSILSALAVSFGLALLLFIAGIFNGEMQGAMQTTIALQSGDLQVKPHRMFKKRAVSSGRIWSPTRTMSRRKSKAFRM